MKINELTPLTLNKIRTFKTDTEKADYFNNNYSQGIYSIKDLEEIKALTFTNIGKEIPSYKWSKSLKKFIPKDTENITEENSFTFEDIEILKRVIINEKLKTEIETTSSKDTESKVRGIRLTDKVFEDFSSFCNARGLKRDFTISHLLLKFMEEN